jgi:hypothetical protein
MIELWLKNNFYNEFESLRLILFNFKNFKANQYLPRTPAVAYATNSDPVSFTRTICGGLILPTIATIVGKLLFQRINSNFQRSIIGGIAFIGLKGIVKIYYKQQQFLRQAHRQIKNYEAEQQQASLSSSSPSRPTNSSTQTTPSQSNINTNNNNNNMRINRNNNLNYNNNNINLDLNTNNINASTSYRSYPVSSSSSSSELDMNEIDRNRA